MSGLRATHESESRSAPDRRGRYFGDVRFVDEIWKPMTAMGGLYEVSNRGRIRTAKTWAGTYKHRVMSQHIRIGRTGSRNVVCLLRHPDGRRYDEQVGRAVLMAHRPVSEMKRRVAIHKDGDPLKNALSNLAWSEPGSRTTVDLLARLAAPERQPLDLGERQCGNCRHPFRHYTTSFVLCPACRSAKDLAAARRLASLPDPKSYEQVRVTVAR